jgi:hypothetical protein
MFYVTAVSFEVGYHYKHKSFVQGMLLPREQDLLPREQDLLMT